MTGEKTTPGINRASLTYQTLVARSCDDFDEGDATLEPPPTPLASVVEAGPSIPETLDGRYERRELLGRGGMGEVWRVWDRELRRPVALKVLHGTPSPRTWVRFEEEARVAAQLQHPGIIPVHDIGRLDDARMWFTMKEVRGRTLSDLIEIVHRDWRLGREGPWTFRRLLEGFLRVCETLAYAHARGVVHRDIKPSNIMFGDYGEVVVVDWGIAKVLGEALVEEGALDREGSQVLTQVGVVSGTPNYMAPEQAEGRSNEAGPAADVYALGATLYDLLTERPPRIAKNVRALLLQVSTGVPAIVPPSQQASGAPIDDALDEMVLTALSVEEADRYPTAGELADELRLWLDGARKRERARALVVEADGLLERSRDEAGEADTLGARGAALLTALPVDADADAKRPGWDLEDTAREARRRSFDSRTEAIQQLRASLTHFPDLADAHDRLADLFAARHAELEAEGREDEARSVLSDLAMYDRGRYADYRSGTGAITLHTDVPAQVRLHRFVEQGRRLEPVFERDLGETPLVEVPSAMGSYLLTLHAPGRPVVRYPVWIRRGEHWDGVAPGGDGPTVIAIPAADALAEDDVYVPAGWFWAGDDEFEHTLPLQRAWTDAFVVKRHPVTVGEYCAYLNALLEVDEALALEAEPRVTPELPFFCRDDGGRWLGIDPNMEDLDDWPRTPDLPVTVVTYDQALGYTRWRAEREGRAWGMLTELEWQHAARGADQREYPWGNHMEPAWCQMRWTSGPWRVVPVNTHPLDCSVAGVVGMAGNVQEWTEFRDGQQVAQGGSSTSGPKTCRVAQRARFTVRHRHPLTGFRISASFGETIGPQPSSTPHPLPRYP